MHSSYYNIPYFIWFIYNLLNYVLQNKAYIILNKTHINIYFTQFMNTVIYIDKLKNNDKKHRVRPRKVATDLATGHWAFLHALHVTRTHDVHCHCKTYVTLFITHLTKISTWILNDCTKTNEKFYLHSTQCIQGRKYVRWVQINTKISLDLQCRPLE